MNTVLRIAVVACAASIVATGVVTGLTAGPAVAAGSEQPVFEEGADSGSEGSSAVELYAAAAAAIANEEYEDAVALLERARKKDDDNADVLNMLAYSNRKLGNLEEAFDLYGRALELRPNFPEAREYLGEAHVDAALEQLRILEGYGARADKERAGLAAALRAAGATLREEDDARSPDRRTW